MTEMFKALQEYLDINYPMDFDKSLGLKMNEAGIKTFKSIQENRRNQVTDPFLAGYTAAFKHGNMSPNSEHIVISRRFLLKNGIVLEDLKENV